MKIVIIGPVWPFRGGIAQLNESLAAELIGAGHEVNVVNFTTQYPSFLFPGKSQFTTSPRPEALPKSERKLSSINPLTWLKTARAVGREKPDLVIVRYWLPFMAPSLGTVCRRLKRRGVKVLAITDNIVPHERHFYDRPLTRYFLDGVSAVLYMSGEVGRELREIFNYSGATVFSPHPLYNVYGAKVDRDEACRRLGLDPSKQYVLFFGFIRQYKGLDLLLDGWYDHADRALLVAGEFYGSREKYMPQIEAKNVILNDRYIAEGDVALYFSAASLVVQPYKTATQSGVTQIAYHFGVPMVVTNVGGLPEIVPHERVGFVVEPRAEAIGEAVDRFFNEDRAAEFSANIEHERKRFEWSEMVKRIEQIADI